jgi:hypothetical protein
MNIQGHWITSSVAYALHTLGFPTILPEDAQTPASVNGWITVKTNLRRPLQRTTAASHEKERVDCTISVEFYVKPDYRDGSGKDNLYVAKTLSTAIQGILSGKTINVVWSNTLKGYLTCYEASSTLKTLSINSATGSSKRTSLPSGTRAGSLIFKSVVYEA